MKYPTKFSGMVLLALSAPLAAFGAGGVEWGNGEGGFSNEVPRLELPFSRPLEVAEQQCRLFFADGIQTPVQERFKKQDKGWCVLGEVEEWDFFKLKKRTKWECADDAEKMFTSAIERFKLGLRCETVRRTFTSAEEFVPAYPAPSGDHKVCGPFLISKDALRVRVSFSDTHQLVTYPREDRWLQELLYQAEKAPSELLLSQIPSEYDRWAAARWMAGETQGEVHYNRPYLAPISLFELEVAGGSAHLKQIRSSLAMKEATHTCKEVYDSRHRLVDVPVKLSPKDQATLAAMDHALQAIPLATLAGFSSAAELLHYRVRNQQLMAQVKAWYESLHQATLEVASPWDPRYLLQWDTVRALDAAHMQLVLLYAGPVGYAGTCNKSAPSDSLRDRIIVASDRDCTTMNQSITKIQDRIERLKFAFPNPVPVYDRAGCRYIVDIAATIQELHNRFFIFDDFPVEFFGSDYARKILETMQALSKLRYRREVPGEFLETILPRWREVCGAERSQIDAILAGFRKP